MALTNAFYESIKEGNIRRVRIMMKDSLLVDPTFTDFNNMEKATRGMSGLYNDHDNKEFILDESQWNDEYMDRLMVQVVNNFSHERIKHLKNVVRKLRPIAQSKYSNQNSLNIKSNKNSSNSSYKEQKYRDQRNGDYLGAKISAGAVTGAVVGGVVASVAGITVIGGVAVGAVVGGVAVTVNINGGK